MIYTIKSTPDNTALLREYSLKNFTVGDGDESPSQKVVSLQSALKTMEDLSKKIRNFLEKTILSEELLGQQYFSEQCSMLNYTWWKTIVNEELPHFVSIDLEELVRFLLFWQITNNHEYSQIFLTSEYQETIEREFDGIG